MSEVKISAAQVILVSHVLEYMTELLHWVGNLAHLALARVVVDGSATAPQYVSKSTASLSLTTRALDPENEVSSLQGLVSSVKVITFGGD